MWPSKDAPPEKPNPLDANLSALWDLIMHINGRVDASLDICVNRASHAIYRCGWDWEPRRDGIGSAFAFFFRLAKAMPTAK